jgi:hypothetical protein
MEGVRALLICIGFSVVLPMLFRWEADSTRLRAASSATHRISATRLAVEVDAASTLECCAAARQLLRVLLSR